MKNLVRSLVMGACLVGCGVALVAQAQNGFPPNDFGGPPPGFGGGPGGPGGFGGGPGGMGQTRELVSQFDKDNDGRLNAAERQAAREFLKKDGNGQRRMMGPGGGRGESQGPAQPGRKVSPSDVKSFPDAALYDAKVLRTIFLQFENADWEKEMAEFNNTDVEVPAKVTVDGKSYEDVGVHFRGASSFMGVPEGRKRSLNLSMDFVHKDQNLGGYRTLNLLNANDDPTFLRTILYSHIAGQFIASPKANLVHVVINGESWGVYVNAQQFNKDFTRDNFNSTKGARWKVPGSPQGRGSLAYLGDDASAYKRIYEIKTKDDAKSWASLIKLCKVLNQTPPDKLEAELAPLLDIDGALKFLALENALINNDGYWVRTSDYSLYMDEKGKFHVIPHDTNETFSMPMGPGMGGGGPGGRMGMGMPMQQTKVQLALDLNNNGEIEASELAAASGNLAKLDKNKNGRLDPEEMFEVGAPGQGGFGPGQGGPGGNRGGGGGSIEIDPLVMANDSSKPLISKLLAVPALRQKYLGYVREIAEKHLDWSKLGPVVTQYHNLMDAEVKQDTRKLESYEAYLAGIGVKSGEVRGRSISLKGFAEKRRAYLIKVTERK